MKRFKKTNIEISHDTMCIKFLRFLIFNDLEKINVLKKDRQDKNLVSWISTLVASRFNSGYRTIITEYESVSEKVLSLLNVLLITY